MWDQLAQNTPCYDPEIPKYRVKNRRNTDTAFVIGRVYLKLYPSPVFVYLKHVCTRNQAQTLQENVRRP